MSSNTNIGNTPVNQGYVQLIHTGETGGIDGTLRTLYDGDGTASDLQIASNKVKVSTELYIGSKTATEFIQDIVGDMFTTGSYTNITTTYDDTNGNIDLSASGEVTLTGTQTLTNKTLASPTFTGTANGANLTLTGDLTVSGDTIFTNSNTVLIGDAILTLNADETGSPTANAGFEVERGTSTNKTFIWNETDDKWTIGSETFVASTVEANLTGNVTGNVTGSASLNLLKSSNLSDLANVATARTNLGVDVAGTDNSTDVTLVTTSHDYLSLAGQAITLGTIDISDDTNLVGGTGITLTGDTLSTTDSEIVHDNLSGFVANEHKDHSAISITTAASSGLSGGGDITTTRSLSVDVNNLDAQVPALELADKIAIYDNSATETNVATLTQLKAIVNTDTDTNQLTTFNVSGDSGTNQTISHNNTLTISGGNGISTSTSATDILSVALGGFSTLIAQSSPAEQDLLVIEEAIGGAIKKVQVGALSSGITIDGTTANGILTYGGVDNIDTESNLTFDGSTGLLLLNQDSNAEAFRVTGGGGGNKIASFIRDVGVASPYAETYIHAGGADPQITFRSSANQYFSMGIDLSASSFKISENSSIATNDRLTIDTSGNVGIGTESPTNFGAGFTNLQISGSTAGVVQTTDSTNSATTEMMTSSGVGYVGTRSNHQVRFKSNNSTAMTIDTSQRVGIGTTSPTAKLEVNSSDGTETLRLHKSDTNIVENEIIGEILFTTADSTLAADRKVIGAIKCFAEENYSGANSNEGSLQFFTTNATDLRHSAAPTPRMVINEDGHIQLPSDLQAIEFGAGQDGRIYSYNDDLYIVNQTAGQDIIFRNLKSDSSAYVDNLFIDGSAQRVGIGTTTPSGKLDVQDNTGSLSSTKDITAEFYRFDATYNPRLQIRHSTSGTNIYHTYSTTAGLLTFGNGGTADAMAINSSGNVGIGTNSPDAKLEVNGSTNSDLFSLEGAGTSMKLVAESGDATSGNVMVYRIGMEYLGTYTNGFIDFYRGGGGTDGYLTFGTSGTEKMRIASSGNVGIGTTSPAHKLEVEVDTNVFVGFDNSIGGTTGDKVMFVGWGGSNAYGRIQPIHQGTAYKDLVLNDGGGNVGIGTASPSQKLHTNGTAGDTRTRTSTSNHGTYFESGVTSDSAGILLVAGHASSILNIYLQGAGGTQNQFRFTHNGDFLADEDIVAYSTSVGSDRKLKDNIKDTSYGLSDVMKMRAVEFDWKEKRDKAHDIGVIAQEIEEIIPEVVKEVETLNTDGETHKVVDYAKLSSVLIKAIQEQQEQINELKEKLNG